MAEEDPTPERMDDESPAAEGGSRLAWLAIALAITVVCTVAGFGLGRLLPRPQQASADQGEPSPDAAQPPSPAGPRGDCDYITFKPLVVPLSGPRMDRTISITLVLAVAKEDFKTADDLVTKKTTELRSWMTVYLSGYSLDDIRGSEKLNRLRRQICDSLNEQLWPDSRPLIQRVLLPEFYIQ
jgi:flagellar basal body-associated protein FliL